MKGAAPGLGEHLRRRSQARPGTPSPVRSYTRSASIRCRSHALASGLRLRPRPVRFPSGNRACARGVLRGEKRGVGERAAPSWGRTSRRCPAHLRLGRRRRTQAACDPTRCQSAKRQEGQSRSPSFCSLPSWPRNNAANKPTRMAQLNDDDDRAILVQSDEESAQVVRLGHRGTPSRKCSDKVAIPPRALPSASVDCTKTYRSRGIYQSSGVPRRSRLGDGRAVGSRDPRFEVPPNGHSRLVVAPADALAVLDELWIVSRLRVAPILRPCHLVTLTYYLRVEQPRVLPGENLPGDQRERIRGFYDKIVVTRCQPGAVMRLSPGIIGHLSGGRARGEGLNRCRLRAGGEQSAGRHGRKCGADHLPHLWSSLVRSRPDRSPERVDSGRRNGERFTFAPNIAVPPMMIAPGVRDINAIAARFR